MVNKAFKGKYSEMCSWEVVGVWYLIRGKFEFHSRTKRKRRSEELFHGIGDAVQSTNVAESSEIL